MPRKKKDSGVDDELDTTDGLDLEDDPNDDYLFGNPDPDDDDSGDEDDGSPDASEEDDSDNEEEELADEEESEPGKDKTKEWSYEDLKKAYQNLEKVVGRQGQELGELRKKQPQVNSSPDSDPNRTWTVADIPDMPDNVLESFIINYKNALSDPDLPLEDPEKYTRINLEFQELNVEKGVRKAMNRLGARDKAKTENEIIQEFANKANLAGDDLKKVTSLAKRMSETGDVTKEDLEAATFRLYPDNLRQYKTGGGKGPEAKANKPKVPARIPAGSRSGTPAPTSPTVKTLREMDERDRDAYLDTLDENEIDGLLEALKKKK